MKLINIYENIITEELLDEDRNQAKSILRKSGITDENDKLKQEYKDDPDSGGYKMYQITKYLTEQFHKIGKVGDLGFWVDKLSEYYTNDPEGAKSTPYEDLKESIDELIEAYSTAHKLKLNMIDVAEEQGLDYMFMYLNGEYVDKFRGEMIPNEIIRVVTGANKLGDLNRKLGEILKNKKLTKRLTKNQRKLHQFTPETPNGEPRTDDEVLGILKYLDNLIDPPRYRDDKDINVVRDTSDVIWEGNGQMIIRITKEDAIKDKEQKDKKDINNKVCHGSENWCIIRDPNEYWEGNAGDETFVLFNRDIETPNNRIAIIYREGDYGFWNENDKRIDNEIDEIIPNKDEIINSIKKNG